MLILYQAVVSLLLLISPFIIIYRILKKKEDTLRFKEKFCLFTKKRVEGKLIWFHGASVGELQSVVPLVQKLEKNNEIKNILITTNTLSSSIVIKKLNFKKVIHQFFPIDTNYHSKKFLNYWKPSVAFFIDSEIWPNTIINLEKNKIPIIVLNGRITKKTFKRWNYFSKFSNFVFNKINLCLSSSKISLKYFRKLGIKNLKYLGNLKFSQSEKENIIKFNNLNKILKHRKIWCASSTHYNEELFCGQTHKKLKKKHKNILTIIIPRHVDRLEEIKSELSKLNLNISTYKSKKKIDDKIDIYIIDAYGKTKSVYTFCKNIFLGGSIINHGGQNPLEATRYGCNILHGPNVENFKEIYNYLSKLKLSSKINNPSQLSAKLDNLFSKQNNSKIIQKKLKKIGEKILVNTHREVYKFIKDEI